MTDWGERQIYLRPEHEERNNHNELADKKFPVNSEKKCEVEYKGLLLILPHSSIPISCHFIIPYFFCLQKSACANAAKSFEKIYPPADTLKF